MKLNFIHFFLLLATTSLASPIFDSSSSRSNVNFKIKSRYASTSVTYDNRSLSLNGQRIFIQSGEMHPWRIPVISLWTDVLQKMQAAGMNTVSIYVPFHMINPAPGVLDFTGINDLALFLTIAKEVGLWVIVRPGPYLNAETNAGGFPNWLTTIKGPLRSNSQDYTNGWQPYMIEVAKIVAPFQIDFGGPVILVQAENEFYASNTNGQTAYFQLIKTTLVNNGIIVPITANDANENNQFATGAVSADIYGFDQYPLGFNCKSPEVWTSVKTTYQAYHARTDPLEPLYIAEFQGGSFDPWNGAGYDNCRELTNSNFESGLWAANAKMTSFYMVYGGTSWGHLPEPTVCYDYGAPISETRELNLSGGKYSELKRQSLFLRSVPEFSGTDWVSDSTSIPGAFVSTLRNAATGSTFFVVRQANSVLTGTFTFNLPITTPTGTTTESITLHGRQSKVIASVINYGVSSSLHFTTAEILFAGTIGSRDVLFLYGDIGDQFALDLYTAPLLPVVISSGPATFTQSGTTIYFSTQSAGLSVMELSTGGIFVFADKDTAGTFWNPLINQSGNFANYFNYGTTSTILVGGPYLVRNVTINENQLTLNADLNATATTTIMIIAPLTVTSVNINNGPNLILQLSPLIAFGIQVYSVAPSQSNLPTFPSLTNWKYADSLPEIAISFDDSTWTVAQPGSFNNPTVPLFGKLWLYACEHGFCNGEVLYRGYFNGTGQTSLKIAISGGTGSAGSVWLNGEFLGSTFDASAHTFTFPAGTVISGGSNVVIVLADNSGQEEGYQTPKTPRGIIGYALLGGNPNSDFTTWKIQGKVGGYTSNVDPIRKIFNTAGLYAERENWPSPSFDTSDWTASTPSEGINSAGVGFYRTDFDLDLPTGFDYPIVLNIEDLDIGNTATGYRSDIWVNGWKFGRFVSYLGPQTVFSIPLGIINSNGPNTIAISLWAVGSNGASVGSIYLSADAMYSWSVEVGMENTR